MLKPHADTNYIVFKNVLYNNSGAATYNNLGYLSVKTTTKFTWAGSAVINFWRTSGYIQKYITSKDIIKF